MQGLRLIGVLITNKNKIVKKVLINVFDENS